MEQWCNGAVLINLGSVVQGRDSEDQVLEANEPQLRSYIVTAVWVCTVAPAHVALYGYVSSCSIGATERSLALVCVVVDFSISAR
jgi:hypothetical protein